MDVMASFLGFIMVGFVSLFVSALATEYNVGDSSGWNLGVDYATWASQYSFKLGDTLSKLTNSQLHLNCKYK